jgi:scyllo-inositol 2-dehydrogenase (NADP+)
MIRVAVVGGGWVSCARHVPTMARLSDEYRIVGIINPDDAAVRSTMKRFDIGRHARTLEEADFLSDVDAAVVGTPPMMHAAHVRFLLERGKHVLSEKPMSTDARESRALLDLASERGLTYGLVHNFQFASSALEAQRVLASGEAGRLLSIKGVQLGNPNRRLPSWYEQLPFGLFYDESPHFMYLFQAFGGRGIRLLDSTHFASSAGLATPANLTAQFSNDAGTPISLHCDFESPLSEWYLMLLCEKRLLIVDVFRDILQSIPNDGGHTARDIARTTATAALGTMIGYLRSGVGHLTGQLLYGNPQVFSLFAEGVRTGRLDSRISAAAGLEANRLQDEIVSTSRELSTSA